MIFDCYTTLAMKEKIKNALGLIGIPILLVMGTIALFLFGKGYRIDFKNGEIAQSGVVSIETFPKKAEVYLDDERDGSTPKTISSLSIGQHTLSLKKEGYFDWDMSFAINAEQLIPFEITLFLKEPEIETIYPEEEASEDDVNRPLVLDTFTHPQNSIILFSATATPEPQEEEEQSEGMVQIWALPTTRFFWETSSKPILLWEFPVDEGSFAPPMVKISISPNGQRALVTTAQDSPDAISSSYIIFTNRENTDPTEITQTDVTHEQFTWSSNSQHLVFTEENELRTLDTDSFAQSIVSERTTTDPFIWTTNKAGQIFILNTTTNGTEIIKSEADGSNTTTVVELPQKSKNRTLFNVLPEGDTSTSEDKKDPFNPTGAISDMRLTPSEDQLVLFFEDGIVLYTLNKEQAQVFQATKPSFISFSPDQRRFLFLDPENSTLFEFWFDLEDRDPMHILGAEALLTLSDDYDYKHFAWHPTSSNIFFQKIVTEDNKNSTQLTVLDTESHQTYGLTSDISDDEFAPDQSGDFAIARCGETLCRIIYK